MAEPTPEAGDILAGRYELLETIGRGGFGVVFRARQLNMDREVAIKMLPAQFMALPDIVERFKREAKLTSRLHHPNTITIHDHGRHGNSLYIVMELLRGEDLADLLKREKTLPPERIVSIASQVLKSLSEAHGEGIIHRDLKPENIFICEHGDDELVKVLDFGIAKLASPDSNKTSQRQLTITGSTVGTPVYMSPEQAAGEHVTHSTDLYALGVLMYEMACGRPPFRSDNPVKTMRSHIFEEVPALTNVALRGTALERVILRALAKEPRLRHADARAFLAELRGRSAYISSVPVDLFGMSEVSDSVVFELEGANTLEFEDDDSGIQLIPGKHGASTADLHTAPPNATAGYGRIDTHQARPTKPPPAFLNDLARPLASSAPPARRASPEDSSLLPTPDALQRDSTTSSILRIVDLPINTPMDDEVIVLTQTKREGAPLEHSLTNIPIIDEDVDLYGDSDLEEGVAPSSSNEPAGDWSFGDLGTSREAVRLVESGAYTSIDEDSVGQESSRATYALAAIFIVMLIGSAAYAFYSGLIEI